MLYKNQPWNVLRFKGTGSMNSIAGGDDKAVVDNGTHPYTVKLETGANHNLTIGSHITIAATTNYNGTYEVLASSATKYIYIAHKYIAEDITTSTTFKISLAPGVPFLWGGFKLHLTGSVDATENLTVTLDAGADSVYDALICTKAMNAVANIVLNYLDEPIPFLHKDDELDFAWANADPEVWGLEVYWRAI